MTQTAPTLIAVLLLGVSVALVWSHLRRRHAEDTAGQDKEERRWRARQFRRRMLTSAMIGLLGAAILAGGFVPARESPLMYVAVWSAVLLATLWILLSAVVDMLTTSRYAAVRRRQRASELDRLEGDLKRARKRKGNGELHESS